MIERTMTFASAITETLRDEMRRNSRVFVMGEDVRHTGPTRALWEEFGNFRVIDTPIAESGFTGAGVGAAITGMRPVVCHGRCDFMLYAFDAIANQAAKWSFQTGCQMKVPLLVRVGTGGYRGNGCHHSQSLEPLFMNIPGISVAVPSTPYDAKGLLATALKADHPVVFFEHNQLMSWEGQVPDSEYTIPFGKADIKRGGDEVTVVTSGLMVHKALEAASELCKEGISIEVIDLRTLAPMDRRTIVESVKKTGRLVTLEESCRTNGIGAEVAAIVSESTVKLRTPVIRIANPDAMLPYKDVNEAFVLPQIDDVKKAIRRSARGE